MTSGPFGARHAAALAERGHLCVGIDPHRSLLLDWGLGDDVAGLERFALTAVEALAPYCSVLKPQSAFFERFGSRGVAVLERTIGEARAAGALVLLDVKRGDIGSTSAAYADAYLGADAPLASDAITVSPYLGFGSLQPFIDAAARADAGLFVLAATSNPEGPEIQTAHAASEYGGGRIDATVLERLSRLNASSAPGDSTVIGSFGAVIGATLTAERAGGLSMDFGGPILAPGYGAQGGTVDDLRRIFGSAATRVSASSSRGVLAAGPDLRALREAAERANDELRVLSA